MSVYDNPQERVLFDSVRDANPMFHLHEALWMLAGRSDATWLDQFVGDFSARFAEENGAMHGAYGKRWRQHFARVDSDGEFNTLDQLNICVDLLKKDPFDRQASIQMWDPSVDLGIPGLKDRPCNQQVMLRADRGVLDMTVTCRSNDAVYGCYGANVVHFSFLQEYLSARIGIPMGRYYQISNNFHMYDWSKKNVDIDIADHFSIYGQSYPGTTWLVDDVESFDDELKAYLDDPERDDVVDFKNQFFAHTAQPMFEVNQLRKNKSWEAAILTAESIESPDWMLATLNWVTRRVRA